MNLFSKRKTKNSKSIKKFVQEWLGKLITSETTNDSIKPVRPSKIKTHTHRIEGVTARSKGHQGSVSAVTGKPIITKDGHQHEYTGAIIVDGKQVHRIEGITSSAVGQGQDHSHRITGRTSTDGNHSHKYSIETSKMMVKHEQSKRLALRKHQAAAAPAMTAQVLPVKPK